MSQLSAKITADTSGFRKAVKDAENVLKGFTAEESAAAGALRKVYDVTQDQVRAYKKVSESMLRATDGTKDMKSMSNALRKDIERLKIQWNNLSDVAKRSRFGQSMANSIRTAEAQLRAMQGAMQTTTTATTAASSSMGGLVSIVGRFSPAIGAGTAALKVAKDAFFSSEQRIDEWGRTVEGARGMYQTFLDAINSGSWSGFFENLGKANKEMRDLYDKYDRLGSIRQNNQAAIAIQEAKVEQLRLQLSQGKDVKKELKEADAYLRSLKKQEVTSAKDAGFSGIVTALGSDVNKNIREAVAKGYIEGGQLYLDYATKRVKELETVTQQAERRYVTAPNGMTQIIKMGEDKRAYDADPLLKQEYLALKRLTDKESNEDLVKALQTYTEGLRLESQIDRNSRKIERASVAGGKVEVEGEKVDPERLLNEALDTRFSNNKISVEVPVVPVLDKESLQNLAERIHTQVKDPYEGITSKMLTENAINQFGSLNSSMESIYNTMSNLSEIENPFQFFDGLVSIAQNVMNVTNMIDGLTKTMQTLGIISKATTAQEVADSATKASAKSTEAAANATSASAKTFDAHAAIPFVGAAIAGAMITAMLISISSAKNKVPKFAKGGVISGPTLGLMGEYSGASNNPEVVAPLDKLRGMLADNDSNSGGKVEFRIDGRTLVGVLNKENKLSSRR